MITVTRIVSFEVGGPSVREIIKSSNPTPKYGCLNHGQVAIRWPWEMKRIRGHPCKLERRPRSRADTRERRLNLKSWYLCVIRSSLESEDGSIEGIDESCYVLLLGNWKSIAVENFIYSEWNTNDFVKNIFPTIGNNSFFFFFELDEFFYFLIHISIRETKRFIKEYEIIVRQGI